ncbi:unnamed protein product [Paramecium pentaurelia]|uniref:Uncharacterized protein n=1 Tax=Paramecium pentaurelia TaxID=43138 RepID=A0A8S1X3V9_9CILI|nr:unnamed protein product [Paramecium pentaurelia]
MIQKLDQTLVQNQILTQFYVYQDLQNFVNLLYSLKEVNHFFKEQKNHAMVKLCRNKVILQMNLSNCIHYDLLQQNGSSSILLNEKKNAVSLLKQLEPELEEFKQYIQWYQTNCLNEDVNLKQQHLEDIQIVANFNQNVLSQIIPAINSMDEQVKNLQGQKQFIAPNINQIREKAIKFKDHTRESLGKNFPPQETQIQWVDQEKTFIIYEKSIIKNFQKFEQYEKKQYENIKEYIKSLKESQNADEKFAYQLFYHKKVFEFHPQYYKFYLFGFFLSFMVDNNKIESKQDQFLQFYQNQTNLEKNQFNYKHFVQYLFTIQQKKVNVNFQSYCDYYKKSQQ